MYFALLALDPALMMRILYCWVSLWITCYLSEKASWPLICICPSRTVSSVILTTFHIKTYMCAHTSDGSMCPFMFELSVYVRTRRGGCLVFLPLGSASPLPCLFWLKCHNLNNLSLYDRTEVWVGSVGVWYLGPLEKARRLSEYTYWAVWCAN